MNFAHVEEYLILYAIVMMVLFVVVLYLVARKDKSDPVYYCEFHRKEGCSHVDGMECDLKTCSILREYREVNQKEWKNDSQS